MFQMLCKSVSNSHHNLTRQVLLAHFIVKQQRVRGVKWGLKVPELASSRDLNLNLFNCNYFCPCMLAYRFAPLHQIYLALTWASRPCYFCFSMSTWGAERLNDSLKVIEIWNGKDRIQTRSSLSLKFLILPPLCHQSWGSVNVCWRNEGAYSRPTSVFLFHMKGSQWVLLL